MPIMLSQTYSTVTPESAENGDFEDSGFDWQDSPHTFRECVQLIERGGFNQPSNSCGVPRWLSTCDYVSDYSTGETRTESLHPGSDARSQRYWAKACRAAGIIK